MEVAETGSIFDSIAKTAKDAETNNSPLFFYFIQSNKILEIFSQIFAHFNSGVNKKPFADEKTHGQEFKSSGHQIKFYVGNNWKFRLSLLGTGQEFTWLKLKINRFIWLFIHPNI